jgi:hypothetical protein
MLESVTRIDSERQEAIAHFQSSETEAAVIFVSTRASVPRHEAPNTSKGRTLACRTTNFQKDSDCWNDTPRQLLKDLYKQPAEY